MPLARIGATQLFFVHVPKTGGTSIEAYLRAKGALALHGQGKGWSRAPLQHLHREAWAEIVPPGAYDAGFAILRDPRARLISEFRMRAEPLRPKLRPAGLVRLARNRAAGRPTYLVRVGHKAEYLDFDGWVERVFADYRRDPWTLSNHIRPQSAFIDPRHRLFRLEDGLEPVLRWIDAATGTPALAGAFHERRSYPLPIACSPETEAEIRAFYAEDHALLASLARTAPPR